MRMCLQEKQEIEIYASQVIRSVICENDLDIGIKKVEVFGSRLHGTHSEDSDLDIRVEYEGEEKEYVIFNILNDEDLEWDGVPLDFFPIKIS